MPSINEDRRPASDVFWAALAVMWPDWSERLLKPMRWVMWMSGPTGRPDPRFRVVVGKHDSESQVGVEVAWTRQEAEKALAEVQALLAASTVTEFAGLYELTALV